jgi:hydroxymethylpyrimidine/phosphomethylpyrimidine kinase
MSVENADDMREAAEKLRAMGARAVLIKGGHLGEKSTLGPQPNDRPAIDLLDEAGKVTVFTGEWIDAAPVRGTGCLMSSAIAACLARGMTLPASVQRAKEYVAAVIRQQLNHVIQRT